MNITNLSTITDWNDIINTFRIKFIINVIDFLYIYNVIAKK